MRNQDEVNRRTALGLGIGMVAAPWAFGAEKKAAGEGDPDEGVTAPEDLMKEHGVLNRCLLIYEEGLRRIRGKVEIDPAVFRQTAALIKLFVEEYHEKNEEKYIFPVFERAKKHVELVTTLKAQHIAGRAVTAEIARLSHPDLYALADSRTALIKQCEKFIYMYRPHEAREDTVLFPALRTILKPSEVAELGEKMEEDEHKVLGDEGFEKAVSKIEVIEKQLGIFDLNQFTPS